jgi:ankyrin repeat protein
LPRRSCLVVALALLVASVSPVNTADTRLVDAARNGDEAAVRRLLREGVPVDTPAADGATALHWAVRGDRLALVQALIAAGADVNARSRYGVSPLALAAINGHAPIASALLGAGADANAASPDGETVLMLAARTGRPDVIRHLLDSGADVNAREEWQGETALMWAAGHDHGEAVRLLAARGGDLNARSTVPELPKVKVDAATMVVTALPRGGLTALMLAARQGALDGARALAEAGADLNVADPDGTSALVIAIINAHYDVAALLIDAGASPAVADIAGMTPLYATVDMQHQEPLINRPLPRPSGRLRAPDIVRRLLERGADPNATLKTPLLMRQHNGGDGQLGEGATPLMRAAKVSDVSLMRLLLDHGADPTRRLRNGTTALSIAAARSARNGGPEQATIEAASLLVERGADVNATNDSGETALHVAVTRSDAVVRHLVTLGANLTAVDKFGRTPLDVALGVPGGAGRGRGGVPPAKPPVRESTAALLRELMKARGP